MSDNPISFGFPVDTSEEWEEREIDDLRFVELSEVTAAYLHRIHEENKRMMALLQAGLAATKTTVTGYLTAGDL